MTEIYSNRTHMDIPKRARNRITANVESVIEQHGDNPDQREDMIEDLIDIAYDSYHVGWQAGFIDDTQPDPTERDDSDILLEALEKLKRTIDEGTGRQRGSALKKLSSDYESYRDPCFNPGGTK